MLALFSSVITCYQVIDIRDLVAMPVSAQGKLDAIRDIYVVQTLMETDMYKLLRGQRLSVEHVCYFLYQILRGLFSILILLLLHFTRARHIQTLWNSLEVKQTVMLLMLKII